MFFINADDLEHCLTLNENVKIEKYKIEDFVYYKTTEIFKNFDDLKNLMSSIPVFPDNRINTNIFYTQPNPIALNLSIEKIINLIINNYFLNNNVNVNLISSETLSYQHSRIFTNIINTMPMVDALSDGFFNSNLALNVKSEDGIMIWKIKHSWKYNEYSYRYNCFLKNEYSTLKRQKDENLCLWENFDNPKRFPDMEPFLPIKLENNILYLYPSNAWYTPMFNRDPECLSWQIINRYKICKK